jgi:hypothetical protein
MIKLIALTGKAGSGKSTIATYLEKRYNFTRFRFAGSLKNMMYSLGLTVNEVEGSDKIKPCKLLGGKTPRFAMQTLGTEWGRNLICDDLWINVLEKQLSLWILSYYERDEDCRIVIDDMRFVNEAAWFREFCIRYYGNSMVIKVQRNVGDLIDLHQSETDQDKILTDVVVNNQGTLDELFRIIDDVLKEGNLI